MTVWTAVSEHLPWLRGQAFHVAAAGTEVEVGTVLSAAGFTIVGVNGAELAGRRQLYRSIATVLRLPDTAGANLDALADGLRDLARSWPATDRIVLLWSRADRLVAEDLLAWTMLAEVLSSASTQAWNAEPGHRVVFETVAFVEGGFGADRP
jgi:RNAse (barnase) inhibitor barstar